MSNILPSPYSDTLNKLLDPIPQFVTASLFALAIIGESPKNKFGKKLLRFFECLSCPFLGLFYIFNVGSSAEQRCLYWIPSKKFYTLDEHPLGYKPFGVHTKKINKACKKKIKMHVKRCTTRA